MIYNEHTNKAIKLAYKMHHGQFDKNGLPYIFHPWHLAEQMDDKDSIVVALLHDVLEDCEIDVQELVEAGFNQRVIDALIILKHYANTDYYDYIKKVGQNELARRVKIADLRHNADLTRLDAVGKKDLARAEKYNKSLKYLLSLTG